MTAGHASGLPQDNDDALSRRDMGLEFLDVTDQVNIALIDAGSRDDDDDGDSQREAPAGRRP